MKHSVSPKRVHQIVDLVTPIHLARKGQLGAVLGGLLGVKTSLHIIAWAVDQKASLVLELCAAVGAGELFGNCRINLVRIHAELANFGMGWLLRPLHPHLALEALSQLLVSGFEATVGRLEVRHALLVGHIGGQTVFGRTLEVLFVRVNALAVHTHFRRGGECLETSGPDAFEGFLASVRSNVVSQCPRLPKRLGTSLALEVALVRVPLHVLDHVALHLACCCKTNIFMSHGN